MRLLADIPNTDAPSTDYPGGKIRDKNISVVPAVIGTPINEKVYGDIIQFFQRLLVLGTVTPNELPDNVTNGYQTVQAMLNTVASQLAATYLQVFNGALNNVFITPLGIAARDGGVITEYTGIGANWNMQSVDSRTRTTTVPWAKFIKAEAWILNDENNNKLNLESAGRVIVRKNFDNTEIEMIRNAGGYFDDSSFSSLATERGILILKYEPFTP